MSTSPDRDHKPDSTHEGAAESQRSKRFRFKSTRDNVPDLENERSRRKRHREDYESSHRHGKRHKSARHDNNQQPSFVHSTSQLPPEQAFRESLFDALGDDEGAAFWEGVYGQPIHTYPDTYQDEETGELERMTDEEYAQFVRRKMWEKSWEGIEAAKEEKRKEREKEKQRRQQDENRNSARENQEYDHQIFETQIEASLRRGLRRKDRKRWQEMWQDYLSRWDDLQALSQSRPKSEENSEQLFLRNKIAWPVESGKRKDVVKEEIERFVRKGTDAMATEDSISTAFMNAVKQERVRWHPDKIQQRYGFMEIDESTLKGVTAVFQVFDAMWTEMRAKPS